ncbi:MAG: hypothetical protein IJF17_14845 [Thermoguttaceae bacterium]|nr:hypothetical protein [Thermoguttaceae bacterium]
MSNSLWLKIDWMGGELTLGAMLSPKFILKGKGFHRLNSLTCTLDERLNQDGWKNSPEYIARENEWEFTEPLNLRLNECPSGECVFTIQLEANFDVIRENRLEKIQYRENIFLKFSAGGTRKLVLDSQDGAVISAEDMDWGKFDEIVIKAGTNSIVDLSNGFIPPELKKQESSSSSAKGSPDLLLEIKPLVLPDIIPQTNSGLLFMTADSGNQQLKFYQLAARLETVLGRTERDVLKANARASDFVYRFYRLGRKASPEALYLSTLISRNQLKMKLSENGLTFMNMTSYPLGIRQKEQIEETVHGNRTRSFRWGEDLNDELQFLLKDFALLNFQTFKANISTKQDENLMNQNGLDLNGELWRIGTKAGLDSIRLKRGSDFIINEQQKENYLKDAKENYQKDANRYSQFREISSESTWWKKDLMAEEEEFHWIIRKLSIGLSPSDAIRLMDGMILNNHAVLYFARDQFGLINHSNEGIKYCWGGETKFLFRDEILPIRPGMDFWIGNVRFHIYENYANYLQIMRYEAENALKE